MTLLMRNHADESEADWPEQSFVKCDVLPEIDRMPPDLKRIVESRAKDLFGLHVHDSRLTVVNLPVVCALWAVAGLSGDWWKVSSRRLALLRVRAFDPIWFDEAYRHTVASALGFGLLKLPAVLNPPAPTHRQPRFKVIRGSGGGVRARTGIQ